MRAGRPVARSHSRAVLSRLVVASSVPSGLNATPYTAALWRVSVRPGWPVAGSHSRAVLSSLAVASRLPTGLNATPNTESLWPARVRIRLTGRVAVIGWPGLAPAGKWLPAVVGDAVMGDVVVPLPLAGGAAGMWPRPAKRSGLSQSLPVVSVS